MLVTDKREIDHLNRLDSAIGLNCMKIICPSCNKDGFVISRWVKGPKNKPFYVRHPTSKNETSWCRLNSDEAETARSQVIISEKEIEDIIYHKEPFVIFSGGKDSLCTLIYIKKIIEKNHKKITAIYVDTTASLPEIIPYIKKVCKTLKVRLEIVRPEIDYFTLARRKGIPRIKSRWCCYELKIKPIKKYLEKIKKSKVICDGIRADESKVRANYLPIWFHPSFKCVSISPIFHWSQKQVDDYIKETGLPLNPVDKFGFSAECWCGAYARKSNFEKLLQTHPDIFDKLIELETYRKFTFLYEDGKKIYLKSLKHGIDRKSG